jgi:hypothetical protein
MIVLFHEHVLLLSTYKFIVIPMKYRNFGAFVYDSAEKQMLNAISLVMKTPTYRKLLTNFTTYILLHDCNLGCICMA